jgi:hypothetical protein
MTTGAHDCFADEVAIDFPSVDQAVERLRERFLGECTESDTLTTEISLSPRDGWRGTIVSLDVPVRDTCEPCGGRGEIWTEPCPACSGTGDRLVSHPLRVSLPPGTPDGARFRYKIRPRGAPPVRIELRVSIQRSAA